MFLYDLGVFIFYAISVLISFAITVLMAKDIIATVCFIKPMTQKYDIMTSDIPKKLKGKYIIIFFEIIVSIVYFYCIFIINKTVFSVLLIMYVLISLYYINKYSEFDILEYLRMYSLDLFDWDKIYKLNLDSEIKKQCFTIHNIDYENYIETYLNNLKTKQYLLNLEMKRMKREEEEIKKIWKK